MARLFSTALRRRAGIAAALTVLLLASASCAGRRGLSHEEMWGPFRGRFVDADTGAPIPGGVAYVVWLRIVHTPVQSNQEFYAVQFAVTNETGEYEIPALENPPLFSGLYDGPFHSSVVSGHQRIQTTEANGYTVARWRPFSRIPEGSRSHATSGLYTSFIPEKRAREMLEHINTRRRELGLPPFRTLRGGVS